MGKGRSWAWDALTGILDWAAAARREAAAVSRLRCTALFGVAPRRDGERHARQKLPFGSSRQWTGIRVRSTYTRIAPLVSSRVSWAQLLRLCASTNKAAKSRAHT